MNPVEAISSVFRNYANFSGRARRSEFWWFIALVPVPLFLASEVANFMIMDPDSIFVRTIFLIIVVATIVPYLAVQVRRLHDTDRSAWWLLWLVPPIGIIGVWVLLIISASHGTWGPNRYGPDPRVTPTPGDFSGTYTDMQDEGPIVWSQKLHIFFSVVWKVCLVPFIAFFLLNVDWNLWVLSIVVLVEIGLGLWAIRTVRSNPLRFLVYHDRLIAEYAGSRPPLELSFSGVSSFEEVVRSVGPSTRICELRVHKVDGYGTEISLLRHPVELVACLNERLERYQRDTRTEGGD